MIRIDALIDSLGGGLLRQVVPSALDRVRDVAITGDASLETDGCLILGVGVDSAVAAIDLIAAVHDGGVCAVVVKAPIGEDPLVGAAAAASGLGVVELQAHASWTELVWLTRSILDHSTRFTGSEIPGDPSGYGELFAFADAAAAILSAPVTIEDADSRVLAYSAIQNTSDRARISTIVGRRVPDSIVNHFRSRGVFRRLHSSDAPIWVQAGPDGVLPRLVIPIRVGRELLGSIWAVDPHRVTDQKLDELTRTGFAIALHMLRLRAQSGAALRVRADRLRSVLVGRVGAHDAGLAPGPWRVAVIADLSPDEPAEFGLELWASVMRRHGWTDPQLTIVDDVPTIVVTEVGSAQTPGTWAWLQAIGYNARAYEEGVWILVGAPATTVDELPRSRLEAVELISLAQRGRVDTPTTSFETAWPEVVLARARESLRVDPPLGHGVLAPLAAHDRDRGTDYVTTLEAFLAHYGEPTRAAKSLHVHTNTLRYRMKHIVELTGIDLDDVRLRTAIIIYLLAELPE